MQVDGNRPGRSLPYTPAPNGKRCHSSGYVPGRVMPVRPPPAPRVADSSVQWSSSKTDNQATFISRGNDQRRESKDSRRKKVKSSYICVGICVGILLIVLAIALGTKPNIERDENCPDQNFGLKDWNPGHDKQKRVIIKKGDNLRLVSSATVHSVIIQHGGVLVFADSADGSRNISLKCGYILVKDGGALHIGAEKCLYKSRAKVTLCGRSDEGEDVPGFGKKFIGVEAGGTLELHGTQKTSWTLLSRSLPPSGLESGSYFEKPVTRGLNVRVIDQDTGQVLLVDRFDTHDFADESSRLQNFLQSQDSGRIIAIAVRDSAAKNLLLETKTTIQELLGSRYVQDLSYRQAWALVSVIGAGNLSCSESIRDYENHDTGGKAIARREFVTVDGVKFSVSASSQWKKGIPLSEFHVEVSGGLILDLLDEVEGWEKDDQIVIASTDYSMYQAEEFTVLPCSECKSRQVKVKGKAQFLHVGEIVDGIDMRAEVGILTRNIIIEGEMEDSCYGDNWCQFFKHDTFGGHLKILKNFTSVHLSNVELVHMGQQVMGSYPVHFHLCGDVDGRGGYISPTYLKSLAIHHCFSRCVTVHATNGLLIRDSIGYDTLGHCFFLEDGIEQRNILYHNLGLLTKPGTLLPTDRNDVMCPSILNNVYGDYIPVPATDCKAVSTFWVANPNNHLINNAAAGSQDTGIWYLFHKVPTGDSQGLFSETKAELTPLGIFYNNRVHSNFKAGLFIDKGVKITNASADDPREYLCLDNSARFRPHQDADPQKPRVAALIDRLIAFKNNDHGAWVRGGDIVFQKAGFSDNGIGLSFASDGSFPKDEGSSQEISESLFVGESKNYGSQGGQNKYWGVGGVDGKNRTLPKDKTFPIRGFQIYDGPIHVTKTTFQNYMATPVRFASAVGFFLKNPWQLNPKNSLSLVKFGMSVSLKVFFGKPGPWFEGCDLDGDKNAVFHDIDGSVTGFRDTYVGRMDNFLIQHPSCENVTSWFGSVCSGKYAQVYIQTRRPQNLTMTIVRDEYSKHPMTLRGINQRADFQQYQPVVMLQKGYTIHWNGRAPEEIFLYLINFNKDDWIRVGLCYPQTTTFQVIADIYQRQNSTAHSVEDYKAVPSLKEMQNKPMERQYYFDNSTGLLFLMLQARHSREGHSYCAAQGCERVKIMATMRSQGVSNCMSTGYPKYSTPPKATVAMPPKSSDKCENCGASQLVFTSDPHKTYLLVQIQSLSKADIQQDRSESYISVNGTKFPFQKGFFMVTVDACSGTVTKNISFTKADATMAKYLNTGISQRSIILLGSKDTISGDVDAISEKLVPLGTAKPAQLHKKESIAFFGYKGEFSPSWTRLYSSPAGQGLRRLEKYIPLQLQDYGCTNVTKPQRKELELLQKALQ
ncbi:cell surface hyaluronidase isoform X1 [Heterodontus francisci]|uniref:cell surface hyaluronidase isoform X1 n=2 Tax=Heterodontus francisci TaxID=7792 RepID=UPI00355B68B1